MPFGSLLIGCPDDAGADDGAVAGGMKKRREEIKKRET